MLYQINLLKIDLVCAIEQMFLQLINERIESLLINIVTHICRTRV